MTPRFLTTFGAVLLLAFFGLAGGVSAKQHVWDNEDFHCDVPGGANDLHITYYSDSPMELEHHWDDRFPTFDTVVSGDRMTWECTWSGAQIDSCEWVHVGVVFSQDVYNELLKRDIYWTQDGTPAGDLPGVGFNVRPPLDVDTTITYTLYNNSGLTLSVNNFSLWVQRQHTPLGSMRYDSLMPGTSLGVLGDGESTTVEVYVPPPERQAYITGYVLAQGEVEGAGLVGHFVHQHEHPRMFIPALTDWGIAVLLVLLVASGLIVLRNRRRASVRA